jgi:hypothetical protein
MHLAKDDDDAALKNPILNYVHRIVLSPPGSPLTCRCHRVVVNDGGTTNATTMSTTTAGEGGGAGAARDETVDKELVINGSYDDIRSDFLCSRMSPDQLKDGLIVTLNKLAAGLQSL